MWTNTEELRGGGGKLCNGELHNLYCSPDFIRASSEAHGDVRDM
jgi:hypothetical protein